MTYKTQSELFEAVARVCKIAEENDITDWWRGSWKYPGSRDVYTNKPSLFSELHTYEFAIGLVEGKWVFSKDTLYRPDCVPVIVDKADWDSLAIIGTDCEIYDVKYLSWNPPKPRTVMVEMLREDAEFDAGKRQYTFAEIEEYSERKHQSAKKALEKDNA